MSGGDFKTKKIDSLTLGERMKKIRSERRLSLSEISKNTRIQVKYLEYLENGEYHRLPADVYVRGFLKSYADFFGTNEKHLARLYEREKGIQKNVKKIDNEEKTIRPLQLTRWVVTPGILIGTLVALIIFSGFFYIYKEVDTFISEPRLVVTYPQEGQKIEEKTIAARGITDRDSTLTINGQPVMVGENGEFSADISLQKGNNSIAFVSRNKFEKESIRTISVAAEFKEDNGSFQAPEDNEEIAGGSLRLEIEVKPDPTWLEVMADGNIVFSGTLAAENPREFEAEEKISVTSGKGNQTHLKLNGRDLGILSESPGIVRDVLIDAGTENLNSR